MVARRGVVVRVWFALCAVVFFLFGVGLLIRPAALLPPFIASSGPNLALVHYAGARNIAIGAVMIAALAVRARPDILAYLFVVRAIAEFGDGVVGATENAQNPWAATPLLWALLQVWGATMLFRERLPPQEALSPRR